jgi:c(7)-type cytochrome triheme protein
MSQVRIHQQVWGGVARRLSLGLLCVALTQVGHAEYADVVLNKRSEAEGVRPVIFPHWFHRIRFQCRVCHGELGFEMRAGANDVTMDDITQGKFCGACHNGEIAWTVENCDLCHSAKPGTATGIRGGHQTTGPGLW